MPFNQWLIAVGLMVPLGLAIHLSGWQASYDAKPKWIYQTISAALLIFWLSNVAFAVENEVKRNCTTILQCGPKR